MREIIIICVMACIVCFDLGYFVGKYTRSSILEGKENRGTIEAGKSKTEEEKKYRVELYHVDFSKRTEYRGGPNKLKIVDAIMKTTGLTMRDAMNRMDLLDNKESVELGVFSEAVAQNIKIRLWDCGARVELTEIIN